MLGANGNGGLTFASQWSASTMRWLRTDGIAEAITSGSVSSSKTRAGGAAKRRSPLTWAIRRRRLTRQRDLRQPERPVEVDPAQARELQRRELPGHDRRERAQPLRHARQQRQRDV